jgi:hypothetical protein
MPDHDEDFPDAEWWGRPQDDPKLIAVQDKARAEFRRQHPPVNCWIDGVQTIELYLAGVRRAQVERDRSTLIAPPKRRFAYVNSSWIVRAGRECPRAGKRPVAPI